MSKQRFYFTQSELYFVVIAGLGIGCIIGFMVGSLINNPEKTLNTPISAKEFCDRGFQEENYVLSNGSHYSSGATMICRGMHYYIETRRSD